MKSFSDEQICEMVRPHVEKAGLKIISINAADAASKYRPLEPTVAVHVSLKGTSEGAVQKKMEAIAKAMSKAFGGNITSELLDEDDDVPAGQVMMEFDQFPFKLTLEAAQALNPQSIRSI